MTNDWDSISALAPPAPAKSVTPDWDSISKPDTATATDYLRAGESGLTFGTGSNINAAARYLVGNKTAAGSGTYDDLLAEERARLHNVHNQDPLGAGAAELAGGLALPGGLALRGAAKAAALGAPAAATLGEAVYGGAKTGAAYGAASGFGNTESDKDTLVGQVGDRIGGAIEGGAAGAVIGGVIPAATSLIGNVASSAKNAISPAIARATSGPDAAADRIIANRLQNTGRTVDDVRNDIAQRQSDKMIAPGTTPSDVTALADAVPELAPILGSAVRASPEARQQAKEFFAARQRGEAIGDSANSVAAAGVETRPAFTPRDATLTKAPPAGQRERIVDALQDALDIGKNPPTAYSATENLLNSARRTADIKYDASRAAGQGVDLVPHIGPVLDQWQTIVDNSVPGIASPLRNAMAQFRTANGIVNDIGRFDQAKRVVDDAIGNYHNGIGTRSATVAAELTRFQNDMLGAVDRITTNDLGAIYSDARQHFSSRMRMRDALEAGRSAMTDGTEDALGHYMTLPVGEQRMYRIGLFDSANRDLSRKGKSSDITTYFDTPDKQQLLGALTGRSRAQPFNFSTRMQRFGDVLDDERNIANTQRTVLGGSQTAERTQDDAAFNQQTLGTLFASLRSTPSLTAMGIEVLSGGMTRMFGFTNSTAQSLAARLLNANPAQRDNILNSIEAHMPSAQTSQFRQFVADMAAHMAYVAKAQASQSAGAALAAPNSKE